MLIKIIRKFPRNLFQVQKCSCSFETTGKNTHEESNEKSNEGKVIFIVVD